MHDLCGLYIYKYLSFKKLDDWPRHFTIAESIKGPEESKTKCRLDLEMDFNSNITDWKASYKQRVQKYFMPVCKCIVKNWR